MLNLRNFLKISFKNYFISSVSYKTTSSSVAEAAKIDGRFMIIDVKNEEKSTGKSDQLKYPLLWLRDNCQCSSCFHEQTKSRTIDWAKFDLNNAQPKTVSVDIFYFFEKKSCFFFKTGCVYF